MVQGFDLPRPFDFYVEVFLCAVKLITTGPVKEQDIFVDKLMNEYITFLEDVILEVGHKKKKFQIKVDFNSSVLSR